MKKTKLKVIVGLLFISLILSGCSKDAQTETVQEKKVATTELKKSSETVAVKHEKITATINQEVGLRYRPNQDDWQADVIQKGDSVTVLYRTESKEKIDGINEYWYRVAHDPIGAGWIYGGYVDIDLSNNEKDELLTPYEDKTYTNNEIISRFEPLAEDEVLAWRYGMDNYMWLFAQNANDSSKRKIATEWDRVVNMVFSEDRKTCVINLWPIRYNYENRYDTLFIDGNSGTVEFLFNVSNYKISSDGKYLLYDTFSVYDEDRDNSEKNEFILYSLEEKTELTRFSIELQNQQTRYKTIVQRYHNGSFTILFTGEWNDVRAEATFDPITQEVNMLWDETANADFSSDIIENGKWEDPALYTTIEAQTEDGTIEDDYFLDPYYGV